MKSMLLPPLLAITLASASLSLKAIAAEPAPTARPIAVVVLPSYERLMSDVGVAGKLAGHPELSGALQGILTIVTQGRGLQGLDTTRPWGVVVQAEDLALSGYVFLPITDLERLLQVAEPALEKVTKNEQGVFEIRTKDGRDFCIQQKSTGWAMLTESQTAPTTVPDEPVPALGDWHKDYDAAVRLYPGNVPAYYRQIFLTGLEQGSQRELERKPGESDQDFAVRKMVFQQILASTAAAANDLNHITLGWMLDKQSGTTCFELILTAREDTPTSRQMASVGNAKSSFTGFRLPDAALSIHWTNMLPPQTAEALRELIVSGGQQVMANMDKENRSMDEARFARELVSDTIDVVEKTAGRGRMDGGFALLLAPQAVTLVAGTFVADGKGLESVVRRIAQVAQATNPMVGSWINLDAAKFKDIRLHTLSIPIPVAESPEKEKQREKIVNAVGPALEVVLGFGSESAYLAAGRNAMKTLGDAIKTSAAEVSKEVPPLRLSVATGSVANFVAAVGDEKVRPKAAMVATALRKQSGRDHVNLEATGIANGVKYRLELEEGLLKAIGELVIVRVAP